MARTSSKPRLLCLAFTILTLSCLAAAQTQTPLPAKNIPRFIQPLPLLTVQPGGTMNTIVAGNSEIQLNMCEFTAKILPPGTLGAGTQPTTVVWGYYPGASCPDPDSPQDTYIGPVIVATRGTPTRVRYANKLGSTSSTKLLAYKNSTDQTLHWADPAGAMCDMDLVMGMPPTAECAEHYDGSIPAVPHLHGGEVPPVIDGGPDQWFTSDGSKKGHFFYTYQDAANPAAPNEAIFTYPNSQEAAPIWFHDHTLGATRLNVYAGLAGAYLIDDPNQGLPANLPAVAEIIPIVLQDRMFDTNGQLYFPAGPDVALNPEHPWWQPEFLGDTMVVNGKAWPSLDVQPRRYRFLFLNGSNARAYEMFLTSSVGKDGPVIWQIGTDGGYLDAPVKIDPKARALSKLLLLPGERADVIIDFAGLPVGTKLFLKNVAKSPYPSGDTPTGGLDKIMQFRVVAASTGFTDASYDPASGTPLRTGAKRIVRLVNPATGVAVVTPDVKRQLTLNEVMGMGGTDAGEEYPGGPSEILVNNTKWGGDSPRTFNDFTQKGMSSGHPLLVSEMPAEGNTEQWEIINLTADAHPIHLHLVQFQLINRQNYDVPKYTAAYDLLFPAVSNWMGMSFAGGVFVPGFGPPNNYGVPNGDGAIGGNLAVSSYLKGPIKPPNPNEAGWKDTVVMYPGQVTRIMVRYAPTDKPLLPAADPALAFPFDTGALGASYVWHCHIIDHEDNEMMRPQFVTPKPITRSYVQGTDY